MLRRFLPHLVGAILVAMALFYNQPSLAASGAYLNGDASARRASTAGLKQQCAGFPAP